MKIKIRKNYKTAVARLILAISICFMALFGHQLLKIQKSYQTGDENYRELAALIRTAGSSNGSGESKTEPKKENAAEIKNIAETPKPEIKPQLNIPDIFIDFDTLKMINPDAAAWLYCPDTIIDYPVMRATDYNYYLRHLPDGTYNAYGTLFIDYNWTDFTDKLTIIYGHSMNTGRMFGSLGNYKKQSYFEEHPYFYLYTETGQNYRVDLMYGCVIAAGEWRDRAFMYDLNLDALLNYAEHNTTFISETQYIKGEQIIVFSTCSYEFDDARYIVIGILRPE